MIFEFKQKSGAAKQAAALNYAWTMLYYFPKKRLLFPDKLKVQVYAKNSA